MKDFKRGERRAQNRMLYKRFIQESKRTIWHTTNTADEVREAHKRVHSRTRCSCTMCCSPRRVYGNGAASRTKKELSMLRYLKEWATE